MVKTRRRKGMGDEVPVANYFLTAEQREIAKLDPVLAPYFNNL
jgi:hypothetical protein